MCPTHAEYSIINEISSSQRRKEKERVNGCHELIMTTIWVRWPVTHEQQRYGTVG